MMDEVKLISFLLSPFGRKVEIALRAKGIAYQVVEEDLKNKSEILLEANPVYKKIPVLIHRGRSICESRLIVEYIDEMWPSAHQLFPQDPYDRYLVRFWADFLDHKIRGIGIMCADQKGEMEIVREEYKEMWSRVESGVGELEKRGMVLCEGKRQVNYVDVVMGSWMPWFVPLETCGGLVFPSLDDCPALHRWLRALARNTLVTSTFPTSTQMMDYARKRFHLQ
ncbi:hypothetical protein SUGI_0742320 [Cryptomeria japonica]|nr:hypothetical protein SUGI_0742320 [Cryptomeria japonica]